MTDANGRKADHPIDPIFLKRWSPRALTAEAIDEDTILTILEAARWAPSSYNAQPWLFAYALRGTDAWPRFLDLLSDSNRSWGQDASALVALVSRTHSIEPDEDQPVASYSHSLDAGAASGYFALQATMLGWHVHGMVGFDKARAFEDLQVPLLHRVEAMYAVGRQTSPDLLSDDMKKKEIPNCRKPLAEIAAEGGFGGLADG